MARAARTAGAAVWRDMAAAANALDHAAGSIAAAGSVAAQSSREGPARRAGAGAAGAGVAGAGAGDRAQGEGAPSRAEAAMHLRGRERARERGATPRESGRRHGVGCWLRVLAAHRQASVVTAAVARENQEEPRRARAARMVVKGARRALATALGRG
jgi:hypothetical protein